MDAASFGNIHSFGTEKVTKFVSGKLVAVKSLMSSAK